MDYHLLVNEVYWGYNPKYSPPLNWDMPKIGRSLHKNHWSAPQKGSFFGREIPGYFRTVRRLVKYSNLTRNWCLSVKIIFTRHESWTFFKSSGPTLVPQETWWHLFFWGVDLFLLGVGGYCYPLPSLKLRFCSPWKWMGTGRHAILFGKVLAYFEG